MSSRGPRVSQSVDLKLKSKEIHTERILQMLAAKIMGGTCGECWESGCGAWGLGGNDSATTVKICGFLHNPCINKFKSAESRACQLENW